ncbi:DUF1883 domain-containing protein [Rhizobium leguminosarum]
MNFLHNDLGHLGGSETIEVTLDKAANVKLMDTANFNRYLTGGRHQYYGGEVTRSPFRVAVPRYGHWHLAFDLGGFAGTIRAGVRVIA